MNDKMSKDRSLIPLEHIERSILLIRGQKVMLARDLAPLGGYNKSSKPGSQTPCR